MTTINHPEESLPQIATHVHSAAMRAVETGVLPSNMMRFLRDVCMVTSDYVQRAVLDTTPITEEWAATVRCVYLTLCPVDHPTQGEGWLLEGTDHEGNGLFLAYVKFQGQVLQILNAVRPPKEGA